ncbi:heterokaryon incompatibility protein-domain-containing protein [Cercophora newfieldiana]|uniref:Heterokaryon incompatibility protein-domain-containing protein n=1 Tax=Cercophora newfieldiana TaxID=92897 RepID=A0AA39YBW7_9PEZI|nr:heterokaryon incompatibility protein-domain-containing protein [Cercophora newfieldiana]
MSETPYRLTDAYKSALTTRFSFRDDDSLRVWPDGGTDFPAAGSAYQYHPLSPSTSIRLLYLLPRRCWPRINGEPVAVGELINFAVDQTPPYVALSYTWGDPNARTPIFIGTSCFHVTNNLAVALSYLAEEENTLILWVDAICINQADDAEKNTQVRRMGPIYRSAAVVLA